MAWNPFRTRPAAALVAAATRMTINPVQPRQRKRLAWQERNWEVWEIVPQIRDAFDSHAKLVADVNWYAGARNDAHDEPVPCVDVLERPDEFPNLAWLTAPICDAATAIVAAIASPNGGQAAIRKELAVNLGVPGEAYLVEEVDAETGAVLWDVYSIDELLWDGSSWRIVEYPNQRDGRPLPPDVEPIRMWDPHPRWSSQPNSTLRSALDEIEELLLLRQGNRAVASSRIANAGLLAYDRTKFGQTGMDPARRNAPQAEDSPVFAKLAEAMMAAISDPSSAAAVVPVTFGVDGDPSQIFDHTTFDRPMDKEVLNRMAELFRTISYALPLPIEQAAGLSGVNHWCVDDTTEVLTEDRGWVRQDALTVGDSVLALDHTTGSTRWSPVRDIYRAEVVDEPMVSIEMLGHSSLTTPDHKWPVHGTQPWRTTSTLRYDDRLLRSAPHEAPQVQKWTDALVELVGWFWTEGSISADGRRVSIAQSHTVNEPRVARIRAALTAYAGGSDGWDERIQENRNSYGGPVTVFHLSYELAQGLIAVAPGKRPTPGFLAELTRSQLDLFIDVSLQGDGHHYRAGRLDCWQKAEHDLDALEIAGVLAGYAVTRGAAENGYRLNLARKGTVRPVKASGRGITEGRPSLINEETYTGTIWCPVTAEHTWCARRNGTVYFTGNTGWLVDDDAFKSYVKPAVRLQVDGITEAILRPTLAARFPLDDDQLGQLCTWYDASPILVRPSRVDDVRQAYRDGVASPGTYRDAISLDDGDAPTPEELAVYEEFKRNGGAPASPNMAPTQAPPAGASIDSAGGVAVPSAPRPSSLTATAGEPTAKLSAMSRRLGALDRELFQRLRVAGADALEEALRVAANRARSAAQGTGHAAKLRGVPAERVFATLGPDGVVGLSTGDALLDGAWDSLQARWETWVGAAQTKAYGIVRAQNGSPSVAAFVDRQDERRAMGWRALSAELSTMARNRMAGKPLVAAVSDPVQALLLGEWDESVPIPSVVLRKALAITGGADPLESHAYTGVRSTYVLTPLGEEEPPGMIGTGKDIAEFIRNDLVASVWGLEWSHDSPPRDFEPHAALDGVVFKSWDDDILGNTADEWPYVSHWSPGDHDGCACSFDILWGPEDVSGVD